MTILFHDLSNWDAALPDGPCIAKATQGTSFVDAHFVRNRDWAAAHGWPFLPYHFLDPGNIAEQVAHCKQITGGGPVMLDIETDLGVPSMAEAQQFITLHGSVTLAYLPRWFWAGDWGMPSLGWLGNTGLVSSDYVPYAANGPGWAPYGGVAPIIWQYTDHPLDGNAYRGTVDQLRALFANGVPDMTDDQAKALNDLLVIAVALCNGEDVAAPINNHTGSQPLTPLYNKLAEVIAAKGVTGTFTTVAPPAAT